tara:strand:- start:923 stop:1396 length:474 start_codon:yes stop_codon:yes gene_type:complete
MLVIREQERAVTKNNPCYRYRGFEPGFFLVFLRSMAVLLKSFLNIPKGVTIYDLTGNGHIVDVYCELIAISRSNPCDFIPHVTIRKECQDGACRATLGEVAIPGRQPDQHCCNIGGAFKHLAEEPGYLGGRTTWIEVLNVNEAVRGGISVDCRVGNI